MSSRCNKAIAEVELRASEGAIFLPGRASGAFDEIATPGRAVGDIDHSKLADFPQHRECARDLVVRMSDYKACRIRNYHVGLSAVSLRNSPRRCWNTDIE